MNGFSNLIKFADQQPEEWRAINDGVMGGFSCSGMQQTENGTGVFSGELSLENSGGFASVRANVGPVDLSAFMGLELQVRGDGRMYQLRLRAEGGVDGIAYRANFETRKGEWSTSRLAFARFEPTFRGRILPDAPHLDLSRIQQVSFLLADKQPGPFSLEIKGVRTWG